ncbi:MAG: CNNM domain-containing protein [Victivallaceae bacterium]
MIMIILLAISILMLMFFSGCEIGLISSQKPRIMNLANKGDKRAKTIEFFLKRPHLMLATTLCGTNLCIVCASLLAEKSAVLCGFDSKGGVFATSVILSLVLLSAEIIPKNWFRQAPEERCMSFAPLLYAAYFIMFIPAKILSLFSAKTIKILSRGKDNNVNSNLLLREDFRILIRDSENAGVIDNSAADILDRALDFNNLKVKDILTPISDVISAPGDAFVSETAELCRVHNISQLPVYAVNRAGQREWIGVFTIYDAIFDIEESQWPDMRVALCLRDLHYINETDTLPEVMSLSKTMKCRLLAVKNSSGQTTGIVTPIDVTRKLFF